MFGVGGTQGGSIRSTVGSSKYGKDMNGTVVTTFAQWQAAVAQLRTPAGRTPSAAATFVNPPVWSVVEAALALSDNSSPSDALDSNPNATIASLAGVGLVPLAVTQLSCKTFDFTADLPTQPDYFGERWELYKRA